MWLVIYKLEYKEDYCLKQKELEKNCNIWG